MVVLWLEIASDLDQLQCTTARYPAIFQDPAGRVADIID
jgi:hypothetical protein